MLAGPAVYSYRVRRRDPWLNRARFSNELGATYAFWNPMRQFFLLAFLVAACSEPTNFVCYADDTFAIRIDSVTDKITGISIITGTSGYVTRSSSRFELVMQGGVLEG